MQSAEQEVHSLEGDRQASQQWPVTFTEVCAYQAKEHHYKHISVC